MTSAGGYSSNNNINALIPKWKLAMMVGAPVVLGVGYMFYRSSTKPSSKPGSSQSKDTVKENCVITDKQVSIDGDVFSFSTERSYEFQSTLEKAQSLKQEGNKYFNDGKYDEAIAYYNKAIETSTYENPENLCVFYQNRAASYEKLNNYGMVTADCTSALELNPRYVKALIRRARALERSNSLETALEDITAACILEQFTNDASLMLAEKLLKQLGRQDAHEFMATKKSVMPSKHFIRTYFEAFRSDPILIEHDSPSKLNLTCLSKAMHAVRNEDYDNVISYCTEEIDNLNADTESNYKLQLLRGTFYLLLGEHDNAISDFNTIITTEPVAKDLKVNALIKRASMHVQLEHPEKSFCDFDMAIELDPNCGDIYHNRAQVNLLLERIKQAKEDFEEAAKLLPDFGLIFVQKCYANYRYGASKKDIASMATAMSDFQKAFEKFPDCSECYTLYAQMLCDSEEYKKADYYFSKAIEKDPMNATIHVHRGLLQLHWNSNIEEAVDHIKKALELDDKCQFGYETLGNIEVQRGNLKEAIRHFNRALMLGRTEMEVTHIFSLKNAAKTQLAVSKRLGMNLASNMHLIS